MVIYEHLKKDHRKVKSLFQEIESYLKESNFDDAEKVFDTLKTELTAHSKAEEEVFYQPLKAIAQSQEDKDLMWQSEQEHHVVALLLNELSRMDIEDVEWEAKIKVLSELVDTHVSKEEGEVFSKAKKLFSEEEAKEMDESMEELEEQYKGMVDSALAEDIEILLSPLSQTHSQSSIQKSNF